MVLKDGDLLCWQMREKQSVVDEDADGNKDVPFQKGVRIKSNRQNFMSPVYELKAIYHAKSRAARCHVWEKVLESPGEPPQRPEILVVFSPAGTPDTVKVCALYLQDRPPLHMAIVNDAM